ncbi:FAD dependent oxidoreductase [Fusarium tricinctum]|uniref:FAD dependent oxidoreductase n=1 Tax=Fusarium tricinctum TaxID=61284 RepID=A0A8K0RMS4_9HYPO|nr:FAD dependent oxidoreductase [Fusarium tricinctum]
MMSLPPLAKDSSILIVGAGTFGISTAYHLAKRGYTNVTCIDRHPWPSLDSAGHDLNKIMRTEYDEPLYTRLALEALEAWRAPEWEGIFHETGRITTTAGDKKAEVFLDKSYKNLKREGKDTKLELIQGREQIVKHVPQLKNAVSIEHWKGLYNSLGGWTHARKALEKWAAQAEQMGVKFVSGAGGTMSGLEVDASGSMTGIRVVSGDVLQADHYILSTGAASPQLLPELSKQLWSKCWTLGHIQLTDEEAAEWKGVPVIDHYELGFMFEPDPDTKRIKICDNNPGYQNRKGTFVDEAGNTTHYSIPRYSSDHPEDGIPLEAEIAINKFIDTVMPQFSGRPLIDARVCWCTDSPDAHWLIDRHPKHKALLLATGDSGHAFKMFPIIGRYISDALEGRSNGLKKEWAFGERKAKPASHRPDTEVKDLEDALNLAPKSHL